MGVVGILILLTIGVRRYDLVHVTTELSRVLSEPTKIANELVDRAIEYAIKTSHAYLSYSYAQMTGYTPPRTRKKPTDQTGKEYEANEYNMKPTRPILDLT